MSYDVIALACEKLSYRDKLRLAQLLIQTARKEEENANPQIRVESKTSIENSKTQEIQQPTKVADTIKYVIESLPKSKPKKKSSLVNSIKAMFQFQGGISDSDVDKIIFELQKRKYLKAVGEDITYNFV